MLLFSFVSSLQMFSLCHGELHSFTKLWDETLVMVTFLHHSRHSTPATHQNKGEECTISNPIASSPSIITHIHMTQKWSKYACLSIEFEWHQFIILRSNLPFLSTSYKHTHSLHISRWCYTPHTAADSQQDQASQTPNKCLGYISKRSDGWSKQGATDTRTHSPHDRQYPGDSNHAKYTCWNTDKCPQN